MNTIHAYRARFNLLAGNYAEAITAADAVDPAASSVFVYDNLNQNPIYNAVQIDDDFQPRDNFGAQLTEVGDGRLAFFLTPDTSLSDPNDHPVEGLAGFFTTSTSPIPAYVPGEMRLIKAEAMLKTGNTDGAIAEINVIRTKTADQDPFGIGADLPEYNGATDETALTEEIFRQRAAELFMQGLRWEDSRRFERPGPSNDPFERNRDFYPYPNQERLNNPNTPPDPVR